MIPREEHEDAITAEEMTSTLVPGPASRRPHGQKRPNACMVLSSLPRTHSHLIASHRAHEAKTTQNLPSHCPTQPSYRKPTHLQVSQWFRCLYRLSRLLPS